MHSTCCSSAPPWALSFVATACALLALAAPTARGDAGAVAPAVVVATAAELAKAVNGGAAHIVVTDHLDLSTLPVFGSFGTPTTDDSILRSNFRNDAASLELASIRVRPSPHEVPAHLRLILALLPRPHAAASV